MSVAFIGQQGSFSELAAKEYFSAKTTFVSKPEFLDVYHAVENGETANGIIPIENSLAGSIHQNYDLLLKGDLSIVGEIYLKVAHYFMVNKGVTKKNIKRIYSHPQPLAQCRNFLKKFPNAMQIPVSTTSAAVKMIRDEGMQDAAAVASIQAAIDYGMEIIASNIEDNHSNQTRFLVLSKNPASKRALAGSKIKTSIVFSLKNIPGALFKALSVFALRDIDLYKIESRPVLGKNFEYMFYLDFSGSVNDQVSLHALDHLQEITTFQRVLGSYACGVLADPGLKQ